MSTSRLAAAVVAMGLLSTGGGAAHGTIIDLTSAGSSGTIDGTFFRQYTAGASGSGVLDSFVRYQDASNPITQGYNTDGDPFQYDEVGGSFTHSLLLTDIPVYEHEGTMYREFCLDINETGGNDSLLSLDTVELYLTNDPALLGHPFGGAATLVWDMDGVEASHVLLDMGISGSGSGKLDMIMWVPDALFSAGGPYVVLYSRVGGDVGGFYGNTDGFEEWARSCEGGVIPGPGGLAVLAMGLLGFRRRRRS